MQNGTRSTSFLGLPSALRWAVSACLGLIFLLGGSSNAQAQQTCTSQADGNWGNTATWDCSIVPDGNDDVIVDGSTVTVTADRSAASISITDDGILETDGLSGHLIDVGAGGVSVDGGGGTFGPQGELILDNADDTLQTAGGLTIDGDLTLAGVDISFVFDGTGTVGGSSPYELPSVTINASSETVTFAKSFSCLGDFEIQDGTLDLDGQLTLDGSALSRGLQFVNNGGSLDPGSNTVLFTGGNNVAHVIGGSVGFGSTNNKFYALSTNNNQDDVEIRSDIRVDNVLNIQGDLEIGDGSTASSLLVTDAGGTTATAQVLGNVQIRDLSTLEHFRGAAPFQVGSTQLLVESGATIALSPPSAGLEMLDGNIVLDGTADFTDGGFSEFPPLIFSGSGTQTIRSGVNGKTITYPNVQAEDGGTLNLRLSGAISGELESLNGSNVVVDSDITLDGPATLSGTLTVGSGFGGSLNLNGQDFTFNGGTAQAFQQSNGAPISGNIGLLTINNTGSTVTLSDYAYTADSGVTVTNGTLSIGSSLTTNGPITVEGSVDVAGTFDPNGEELTFSGGNTQSFGGSGTLATSEFSNITVDKSAGTVSITDFNLQVSSTGLLDVISGTLDLSGTGDVTLLSTSETESAYVVNSGTGSGGSITGELTIQRFLDQTRSGTIDGQNKENFNHWRLFGFPVAAPIDGTGADALLSGPFTQGSGVTGADDARGDEIVYFYDETQTGVDADQKWTAVTDLTTDVPRGEGRIAFIFTDDDPSTFGVDGGFPKTLSVKGPVSDTEFDGTNVTYNLTITGSDSQNDGWNLRANPFLAPIDFQNANFQVEGDTRRAYWVYSDQDGGYLSFTKVGSQSSFEGGVGTAPQYIAPFQGIFFKAELDGTISAAADGTQSSTVLINSEAKVTSQQPEFKSAPAKNEAGPVAVYLGLTEESNSQQTREAVFAFDPLATRGDDATDTYLLEPFIPRFHVLGSKVLNSDATYEIQTLPRYASSGISIPVEARLVRNSNEDAFGTFTLEATKLQNIPDDWDYLRLVDNKTGNSVDLLTGERFTGLSLDAEVIETSLKSEASPFAKFSPKVMKATSSPRFTLEVGLTPLPVELSFFRGRAVEGTSNAVLEWETLSEENNDRFEVEQQVDGAWTRIGSVEGAGTTNEPQSYRFTVENLDVGEHSFRLRQVDVDGTPTYSPVETVRRGLSNAYQLKTYPNPVSASSDAKVAFAVKERAPVTIELYNTLGQRVQTIFDGMPDATDDVQTETINVSRLSSGVYFVRMRGQGFSTTEKLVVVR